MSPFRTEKLAHALSAENWERQGHKFDPTLHFTGAGYDKKFVFEVNEILLAHGLNVIAYYIYEPLPGGYSVQLQFKDKAAHRSAREMWYSFDDESDVDEDEDDEDETDEESLTDFAFLIAYGATTHRFDVAQKEAYLRSHKYEEALGDIEDYDGVRLSVWQKIAAEIHSSGLSSDERRQAVEDAICWLALSSNLQDQFVCSGFVAKIGRHASAGREEFGLEIEADDFYEGDPDIQEFNLAPIRRVRNVDEEHTYAKYAHLLHLQSKRG